MCNEGTNLRKIKYTTIRLQRWTLLQYIKMSTPRIISVVFIGRSNKAVYIKYFPKQIILNIVNANYDWQTDVIPVLNTHTSNCIILAYMCSSSFTNVIYAINIKWFCIGQKRMQSCHVTLSLLQTKYLDNLQMSSPCWVKPHKPSHVGDLGPFSVFPYSKRIQFPRQITGPVTSVTWHVIGWA